jgi:phosphatidylcholine synthase
MKYTFTQKALAFSVHALTSSGIVAGFMAILAITEHEFKMAMLWLFVTLIIDGVDGTFARLFKVKEVLPNFDGGMIDAVIDFATYAIIPAYFIYEAPLLPEDYRLLGTSIILVVSAMYYGKMGMISNDYYFVGFPIMWNMVAFYLFFVTDNFMDNSEWLNFVLVVIFAIMHFIPIKFLYPSRTKKFRGLNIAVSAIFLISNIWIITIYDDINMVLSWISLACVGFYAWMGIYNTWIDEDTREL